jgi:type VI protein secretion system component Hcp
MTMKTFSAGTAALALLAHTMPSYAATVMEFPDNAEITGKAELTAYNFRSAPPIARQCIGEGGGGTFTITKPVDALSPQLADASKAKKTALLQIDDTKRDGTRVAYRLTDAQVNEIKPAKGGTEQISFNYTKIQWLTISPCKATPSRRNNATANMPQGYGGGGMYGAGGGKGY